MVSHVFPWAALFSNTVNILWKEMGITEKEGSLPTFDKCYSKNPFSPNAEITAGLPGKIGSHIPATKRLTLGVCVGRLCSKKWLKLLLYVF